MIKAAGIAIRIIKPNDFPYDITPSKSWSLRTLAAAINIYILTATASNNCTIPIKLQVPSTDFGLMM